jgi:hypothetical protein
LTKKKELNHYLNNNKDRGMKMVKIDIRNKTFNNLLHINV